MICSVNYFDCKEDYHPTQAKFTNYFKKFHPLHTYIHHDLPIKTEILKAQRSEILSFN